MVKPTSKYALKQQCLMLCNLKVKESEEMYDFLIKGMEESIPDIDPEQKSAVQNFGETANGVLKWFRENQDVLSKGVDMIKGLVSRGKPTDITPLPPINE